MWQEGEEEGVYIHVYVGQVVEKMLPGRGEGGERCWLIGDDRTLYVAGGRGGGGIYTCICGTGGREDAAWEGGGGGEVLADR